MRAAVGESGNPTPKAEKTSVYEKPSLRELGPGEHAKAQQVVQDFLAQMKALGKEPSQAAFESYLAAQTAGS